MDDKLARPVWLVKHRVLWMDVYSFPGSVLCLEGGVITLADEDGQPVFRAPVEEVSVSFPRASCPTVIPFPFFRVSINLTVRGSGNTYRLSFLLIDEHGRVDFGDIKKARAAVRQWRAALGQPVKGTLQLRCLECGAETAEAAQVCAQCGAPVAHQPPVADATADGPGE